MNPGDLYKLIFDINGTFCNSDGTFIPGSIQLPCKSYALFVNQSKHDKDKFVFYFPENNVYILFVISNVFSDLKKIQ